MDALRVTLRRAIAREMDIQWSFWRRPTVDIPTGQIHAAGDAIILRVAVAELREAMPPALPEAAFASIH